MQQHFLLSYLRRPSRRYHTFNDTAAAATSSVVTSINWVRDRALDHAVEKERDLKPMLNVKNLLTSEPSKSLPISVISDKRASLGIPVRPIDFIRKYPSVFQEFLPGGLGIHPHVKLTPEILTLDAEEQLLFQSEIQKQDVANRLLKLLMIARINKLPLCVIDRLKWDLGLPHDYTQSVVPQFPDYFQVASNGNELELVCWSDEVAVSVMEKKSMTSFPLQYSRGFEVDKKFKKWVDGWQKLPYISPYKNALDLQAKSDESDKWTVAVLHELLHLLVPKRTDKDNLLFLGEYLGVRSRFKRALLQHPGIFYVSSKLNTHTVVLREAYKRDLLVSKPQHPLMILRSNYIHLMNMVMVNKSKNTNQAVRPKKDKTTQDSNEGEDNEWSDTASEQEGDEMVSSLSGSESEGVTDGDSMEGDRLVVNGRTPTKKTKFEGQVPLKQTGNISVQKGRKHISTDDSDQENGNRKIRGRTMKFNHNDSPRRNTPNARSSENDGRRRGKGKTRKNMFDEKMNSETNQMSDRRGRGTSRKNMLDEKTNLETNMMSERRGTRETNRSRFLGTEVPAAQKARGRSSERWGGSRTRESRFQTADV
ncbi:protein WHAT'S THIS FACTOR 1-like [Cynara cardunculus var. scolymus]|uniref:Plant organelle RNA recognition domain-containing protein n=1 Tax=Cynara cardunculus var. scolymus TaxID=59895 RepID=A0A103XXQ7_CYNCS|nr:protein WHAT'S THIS FACTOR 1-like [Cynara cardunculus var. scolymus]KVH98731.1 Plant organelle RNA recognition domain-containing protein [Cynara cardunculus var. scolymus]